MEENHKDPEVIVGHDHDDLNNSHQHMIGEEQENAETTGVDQDEGTTGVGEVVIDNVAPEVIDPTHAH